MHGFPTKRALPLCSDVSAFWMGPIAEFQPSIGAFYDLSVMEIGDRLRWFRTEAMVNARPVTQAALRLLPHWLNDVRARRQIATLDLTSGDDPEWPSDAAFAVKIFDTAAIKAGACRLVLPADIGLETPRRFYELVRKLLVPSNFTYALAGFSVNWDPLSRHAREAEALFPYVSARFAGVDIPALTGTVLALPDGIKCVDWITFLCSSLWESLDIEAADLQLLDGIAVDDCLHGVLISAGERPLLGDRHRSEDMRAYQIVGSKLNLIRTRSHQAILPAGHGDDEDTRTESWLARFDMEPR